MAAANNTDVVETEIGVDGAIFMKAAFKQFDSMRKDKLHCDFTIKTGTEEILVHKMVLSASSDYFKAMLLHETQESLSGTVEIKEASPESVKKCVDFLYSGQTTVSAEDAEQMMYTAKLMQLEGLCGRIVKFLDGTLDTKCVTAAKNIAQTYDYKDLETKCQKFAIDNFEIYSKSEDLLQNTRENLKLMIKSKNLQVFESVKCEAIIRWVNHDVINRKQDFQKLLKYVDFNKIPINVRRHLVENEPLICEFPELLKNCTMTLFDALNTKPQEKVNAIVVYDENSQAFQAYDAASRKWKQMQMKLNSSGVMSVVLVKDHIYVLFSGCSVYRLDFAIKDAKWNKLNSMEYRHQTNPPLAVLNNKIYIIEKVNIVYQGYRYEMYDITKDTWSDINRNNNGDVVTAIGAGGFVYAIGGSSEEMQHRLVERYDPRNNQWSSVADLIKPRKIASAAELNRKIYVVGGDKILGMECYDQGYNTWTELSMKIPQKYLKPCVLDRNLYLVGGSGGTILEIIKVLDTEKCSWEVLERRDDMQVYEETVMVVPV